MIPEHGYCGDRSCDGCTPDLIWPVEPDLTDDEITELAIDMRKIAEELQR